MNFDSKTIGTLRIGAVFNFLLAAVALCYTLATKTYIKEFFYNRKKI